MKELIRCFLFGIPRKTKYPEIVRRFCLDIYFLSVRAYEAVRATFNNNLPHVSTVRSWYANSDMNCDPGVSPTCLRILEEKAKIKKSEGSQLLLSICFDEMFTKTHFQYCNTSKEMSGFPTYGSGLIEESLTEDETNPNKLNLSEAANQVIVYMAIGINEKFKLPIAYHFVKSLSGDEKADLIRSITDSLARIGVTVVNITFDGCPSNIRMCSLLGADLNLDSPNFRPFFFDCNQHPIFVMFDAPHMEKLIRGYLSEGGKFYDSDGNIVYWEHFEDLVDLAEKEGFVLTHKMTRAHIDWRSKKMNVKLAVQTFSKSTVDSMIYLKNEKHPKFINAAGTIKFADILNDLFDIFNSKLTDIGNKNIFKEPMSKKNKSSIYEFFDQVIQYFSGLKIRNETGAVKNVLNNTGFKGFIIDMHSLMGIYERYVENNEVIEYIPTYSLSQDPVEIFFGKNRYSPSFILQIQCTFQAKFFIISFN